MHAMYVCAGLAMERLNVPGLTAVGKARKERKTDRERDSERASEKDPVNPVLHVK